MIGRTGFPERRDQQAKLADLQPHIVENLHPEGILVYFPSGSSKLALDPESRCSAPTNARRRVPCAIQDKLPKGTAIRGPAVPGEPPEGRALALALALVTYHKLGVCKGAISSIQKPCKTQTEGYQHLRWLSDEPKVTGCDRFSKFLEMGVPCIEGLPVAKLHTQGISNSFCFAKMDGGHCNGNTAFNCADGCLTNCVAHAH